MVYWIIKVRINRWAFFTFVSRCVYKFTLTSVVIISISGFHLCCISKYLIVCLFHLMYVSLSSRVMFTYLSDMSCCIFMEFFNPIHFLRSAVTY